MKRQGSMQQSGTTSRRTSFDWSQPSLGGQRAESSQLRRMSNASGVESEAGTDMSFFPGGQSMMRDDEMAARAGEQNRQAVMWRKTLDARVASVEGSLEMMLNKLDQVIRMSERSVTKAPSPVFDAEAEGFSDGDGDGSVSGSESDGGGSHTDGEATAPVDDSKSRGQSGELDALAHMENKDSAARFDAGEGSPLSAAHKAAIGADTLAARKDLAAAAEEVVPAAPADSTPRA